MGHRQPIASLIITNYNGGKVLLESLKHLTWVQEDYTYELIIADNGSTDNSCNIAVQTYPWIKSVRSSKNLGFGGGCNLGAKHAKGNVLIFVNSDAWMDRYSADVLVTIILSNPNVGAIGPVILKPNSRIVDSMGGHIVRYLGVAPAIGSGRYWTGPRKDDSDVPYVSGALLATPKNVFIESGGFDPLIFLYHEEVDYCWRLRLRGFKVKVVLSSTAFHAGSSIVSKVGIERSQFMNFGRILTNAKNLSRRNLVAWLACEVLSFCSLFARSLRTKRFQPFCGYIKAWFSFLTKLPLIIQGRRLCQYARKIPDDQILKEHIPFTYLLRNSFILGS